jgi:hypothetical protein
MSSVDQATETMIQNLMDNTGKSLDEWVAIVRSTGIEQHKEMLQYLQNEHGLTYGYANLVALTARGSGVAGSSGEALLEEQYKGAKAAMRPIYDALIAAVTAFGDDVEIAPKKTYVSLRRKRQFAIFQPSTTRMDVGINLKGVSPAGRLEASGSFNSMVTHRVRVTSTEEVDEELVSWLRQAYQAA